MIIRMFGVDASNTTHSLGVRTPVVGMRPEIVSGQVQRRPLGARDQALRKVIAQGDRAETEEVSALIPELDRLLARHHGALYPQLSRDVRPIRPVSRQHL